MDKYKIDAKVFLKQEKLLLQFLMNHPLAADIKAAARKSHDNFGPLGYAFEASWEADHHGRKLKITVAGQAELNANGNFNLLTYAMCVCENNLLLRKYHYDHESNTNGDKPFFHLQYGGNPLPSQEGCDGQDELASWFSEPRLFSTPMSLVLILEQVFLEFPSKITDRIHNDNYWKNLVVKSQEILLKPYFELCCQKIVNNERLYSECYI